ncbi:MAG: FGGY-family carbohydrate kinase [Pseudomonadota bacterium]
MTGLALGIDLGTSGVRSAVLDRSGDVVAMARGSYGDNADDRRDPIRWWNAVSDCLDAQVVALREAGVDPRAITGLAVDGTSGSLVLTDASLEPVTRALMYDDGGFHEEADKIAAVAPASHVARGPGSALARALRLVTEDTRGRALHLLHQADFIACRFVGQGGWSDYNNALKTGFDPKAEAWPDWISDLPMPATLLPHAKPPGYRIGHITARLAHRFGLSEEVAVHAGTTDSLAAFLAAAKPEPGAAVTSLGTTLAIKLHSEERIDDPALGLYAHRLGDGWLVGGASNTGGGVLKSLFSDDDLARLSAEIDPKLESPCDFYPLCKPGERFPLNDPGLQPRLSPRPKNDADFLHGILESIARIEKQAYQVIADRGALHPTQVITAGGGARNQTWAAIRSRVLGVQVVEAEFAEAAVGAARLAGPAMRKSE